ncbi:MAG: hypothetical protein ACLPVI_00110 [Dehalococcoidales bacterium]
MGKKKSKHRLALLWFGAILTVSGNLAMELGHPDGAVATIIGVAMATIGCYLWTRDKNRASGFALWGLLAPVGYLVIMSLKDKSTQRC